jgi:hypothetical protein
MHRLQLSPADGVEAAVSQRGAAASIGCQGAASSAWRSASR